MNGTFRRSERLYSVNGHKRRAPWLDILKLATPGIGLKRWMLLGAFGMLMCLLGLAYVFVELVTLRPPDMLPLYLEGVLLLCGGGLVIYLALFGLYRSVGPLILDSPAINSIANTIYTRRSLARGPRIVAIGGGTGLSVLLRGLKEYTDNITAIVTVGDDGGSSGRLREELGVLPPGDFRNCLVAMSDAESLVGELFQYRFDEGDCLKGHSFGNLFIAAMTGVTQSFDRALVESSRVLAVHGRIVPATMANLRLSVKLKSGQVIHGESKVVEAQGGIERLMIDPPEAEAHPMAIEALKEAQLIVVGPGSLYTSILPNLMVKGITEAIRSSSATKVYVSNIATQEGETEGYSVIDHHDALTRHTFPGIVDNMLANDNPRELGPNFFGTPVRYNGEPLNGTSLHMQDLIDSAHPVRHDSHKLARSIMEVYHESNKPRSLIRLAMN
ncbi:MAG: YvcK family protein [Chloroflexi bacterium]|nr:YvcK family protein [Chloroflexota bacterium]